ncbi:hypothetical protein [Dongia sp.]|uniref:hypothetical protein n=1 Tax=Dongia sp. TaxID=1977262 RepID=UPI0035ADF489
MASVGVLRRCLIPIIMLCGSCSIANGDSAEALADAAVDLGYLAGALDGLVEFGQPTPGAEDMDLLKEAVGNNTRSLNALKDFTLKARYVGQFSSVLMCDKTSTRAIAEDAGCTPAELDEEFFSRGRVTPPVCAFVLDPNTACAAK